MITDTTQEGWGVNGPNSRAGHTTRGQAGRGWGSTRRDDNDGDKAAAHRTAA